MLASVSEASQHNAGQKQQEGDQHRLKAVSAHHRNGSVCVPHEES